MRHSSKALSALVRVALIAGCTLGVLTAAGNVAWACVCDHVAPHDAVRNAHVVVTGVAGRRIEPERVGFGERIEFTVETVYKGAVPDRWAVSVDATSCGYVFTAGKRYTVFAREDRTNLCMGNVEGDIDPTVYGVRPITTYPSAQLVDLGRTADRIALGAALTVVALGALLAIRRRRAEAV